MNPIDPNDPRLMTFLSRHLKVDEFSRETITAAVNAVNASISALPIDQNTNLHGQGVWRIAGKIGARNMATTIYNKEMIRIKEQRGSFGLGAVVFVSLIVVLIVLAITGLTAAGKHEIFPTDKSEGNTRKTKTWEVE